MSSVWKNNLSLTIFGQSHGTAIGCTLDGLPAGYDIDMAALNAFLKRRAPGRFPWSTARQESDEPEFLSGLIDGRTCGAPITAIIRNENARPADYAAMRNIPRPGHADYSAFFRYGEDVDLSGGGHFSGRLTAALCIAGGLCLQVIGEMGISIGAHVASVGDIDDRLFDPVDVSREEFERLADMNFPVLDTEAGTRMIDEIAVIKSDGDSIGGVVECAAVGLSPGFGDAMFGGMEGRIASLVFAIPAVKGIEFGAGFGAAKMRGSQHNDPFYKAGSDYDRVRTRTNNHGGILGGISSGMPVIFRAAIKPTPSIGREQESVLFDGTAVKPAALAVKGRHDPCIVPRAVPCMEAALAIAICDVLV